MPDRYLSRTPASAANAAPDPLYAAVLVVGVLLAIVIIGRALLTTIAIDNSTGYGISYNGVRAAITQVLDKDLAADRIQEVLTDLPDPTPGTDEKAQEKRKTDRAARLKSVAVRLNGDRARLADALATLALKDHPGLDPALKAMVASDRRQEMARRVAARLDGDEFQKTAETWVTEALDARSRAGILAAVAATNISTPQQIAATTLAKSLSNDALKRSTAAAIELRLNPFDARPGESAWASDVGARLAWAVVALLFSLTFGLLVFTSVTQIWRITNPVRVYFIVVIALLAALAGILARNAFSPANDLTPLHVAFKNYATLFGVGMLAWADAFNVLRGAGVVMLVAGAVATFWVKVRTSAELDEQLRGFKTMFNAGAIFLLAGTLEVYAGFRWPIVFVDDATRTALQAAAAAFAATIGAAFSVIMLTTYFATTFVLRQQAIAHGVLPPDVDRAFQTFGFSDLTSQQFLRFAQSLLPLVPGVVTVAMS
jgi:hypothetical protein